MTLHERALEQVVKLARTVSYPNDRKGFELLLDGLVKACNAHSVTPTAVVAEALIRSRFCPTDFDLNEIAKSLAKHQYEPVYTPERIAELRIEFQKHPDLLAELNALWGPG